VLKHGNLIFMLNGDYGAHPINPTTPTQVLQEQQHDASMKMQRPPPMVLWTPTPMVLKRLLNNAKGLDQQ
jgi:hypothetical protein